MKYFLWLAFSVFMLAFPIAVNSESTGKEHELICDEAAYYGEDLHVSIAEIHDRLVSLSWPETPPTVRFAKMRVYAVFQIKVSLSGEVCSVEFIGGNVLIKEALISEIKKWKFRPNMQFLGLIAIRYVTGEYASTEGFRLL